jgi:hypothetical protein
VAFHQNFWQKFCCKRLSYIILKIQNRDICYSSISVKQLIWTTEFIPLIFWLLRFSISVLVGTSLSYLII